MSEDVTEIAERYARVAAGFDARLSKLADADWESRTPCTEWDARALVAHVLGVHRMVGAMLDGREPAGVDDGEDLVGGWRAARDVVVTALDDPATATRVVDTKYFGQMPFASVVGGILTADTLIHTWDLSRATGQDEGLDPAAVAVAHGMLQSFGDGIRSPGAFGPAVEPPPGADEQAQFIAFCGRAV